MKQSQSLKQPWARPFEEVAAELETDLNTGLEQTEAKRRLERFGENRLQARKQTPAWKILWRQIENLIVLLLAVAAGLSMAFGQWLEAASIAVAIAVNIGIGFFTELKAVRSMESLTTLDQAKARVLRSGKEQNIPVTRIAPGDLVLLEAGDVLPADMRVLEAAQMQADEAALSGESLPVDKQQEPVVEDAPLAERTSMLFKGTVLSAGSGKGLVTATGMETELGRIAKLTEEAEEEVTPLEKRLDDLGRKLLYVTLAICAVVAGAGLVSDMELLLVIETAIALAVAAIPEGLPIVATIALARGMWRLAERNALLHKLSAVETLGAVSVICSDKTGTLTENRMSLDSLGHAALCDEPVCNTRFDKQNSRFEHQDQTLSLTQDTQRQEVRLALLAGVLCNNATLGQERGGAAEATLGDPLEAALLEAGAAADMQRDELLKSYPEIREDAFSQETKMMATWHRQEDGQIFVAVKGAPEAVLQCCSAVRKESEDLELDEETRNAWSQANQDMAARGLRMLAVACKTVDKLPEDHDEAAAYSDLSLLALAGLLDPPRSGIAEAIEECRRAGIRVVMVTGDHAATATSIARNLGLATEEQQAVHGQEITPPEEQDESHREALATAPVFARVSPEQKLDLVKLLQQRGEVVGMTGDGINDAPALKKADIGIAMGQRGSQAAQEAAAMVLKDDAFSTIVLAIKQGRGIFNNIRRFIVFLLSGNMAEIAIVALAMLVGLPLPLLPLQILYLNMLGDVFPALSLGVGRADPSAMMRPPRPKSEPIVTTRLWWTMAGFAAAITAAVLASFVMALSVYDMGQQQAVAISFLTLAFARLWHVFNMRGTGSHFWRNTVTTNPWIWGALALCVALLLLATYLPGLAHVLDLSPPGRTGWSLILGYSLAPTLVIQAVMLVLDRKKRKQSAEAGKSSV